MPAGEEGAAPASAWLRAGGSHLRERQEGCRLANREQRQTGRDRGQELTTSGKGDRDAGLRGGSSPSECMTADRNGPSLGEGRGMPAGEEGPAPRQGVTADRNWQALGWRRAMPVGTEAAAQESA